MHKNYTQLLATLLQKIAKGSVPGYHTCKGTLDKVIISSSERMSRLSLLRPLRLRYLIIRSVVDGLKIGHLRKLAARLLGGEVIEIADVLLGFLIHRNRAAFRYKR